MRNLPFVLRWAIIPAVFGFVLTIVIGSALFVTSLLGFGDSGFRALAVVTTSIFGSASVGGLVAGITYHLLSPTRRLRLAISWTAGGLILGAGSTFALKFLAPVPPDDGVFSDLFQLIVTAVCTLFGFLMGISFEQKKPQSDQTFHDE